MKLWNGRFASDSDYKTDLYNSSISFDIKLFTYDIKATIGHVQTLQLASILTCEESEMLINELELLASKYEQNKIEVSSGDEDVHMLIERLLTEELGELGKKVHTGRSRNDQVAVATRLFTIDKLHYLQDCLEAWIGCLEHQSKKYSSDLMAGCTHLQTAQPITLGFWFDAYKQMFKRDLKKIENSLEIMNECPLGSAALAGTSYQLDRQFSANALNFKCPTANSMDSVADRDYIADTLYVCSLIAIHLSKLAEELILFNSQVYNYVTLDDRYSTGSSIMPQKKNPDIAELARGKSARMIGNLTQLLTLIKGIPLAYNKDFQEDKESLFNSIENVTLSLELFIPMIETTIFNTAKMAEDCKLGFINATDLADYLVQKGIPFRTCHHIVGILVKYAETNNIGLEQIPLEVMQGECDLIEQDVYQFIEVQACLMRRTTYGAPGWFIKQHG